MINRYHANAHMIGYSDTSQGWIEILWADSANSAKLATV